MIASIEYQQQAGLSTLGAAFVIINTLVAAYWSYGFVYYALPVYLALLKLGKQNKWKFPIRQQLWLLLVIPWLWPAFPEDGLLVHVEHDSHRIQR